MAEFPHGLNGYANLRCRCQICRDAWAEAHRRYMKKYPEQQERHRTREVDRYWMTREDDRPKRFSCPVCGHRVRTLRGLRIHGTKLHKEQVA